MAVVGSNFLSSRLIHQSCSRRRPADRGAATEIVSLGHLVQ